MLVSVTITTLIKIIGTMSSSNVPTKPAPKTSGLEEKERNADRLDTTEPWAAGVEVTGSAGNATQTTRGVSNVSARNAVDDPGAQRDGSPSRGPRSAGKLRQGRATVDEGAASTSD